MEGHYLVPSLSPKRSNSNNYWDPDRTMNFGWWDLQGDSAPADAEEQAEVFELDPDSDGNDGCGSCSECLCPFCLWCSLALAGG